jgi:hypothetical protein
MKTVILIATVAATLAALESCKPSVSNVEGFGRGYSQQGRASEIACSLIRAGFLDLPRPTGRAAYEYSDAFFRDRDMVDLFTCIADAESTLGADPSTNYNYNNTSGVLQVKNYHATSGEFKACTGQDLRQLDANTRCSADIYRAQGLGAWEVIALGNCRANQVEKVRCPDPSIEGQRGGSCGASMTPRFSPDGSMLNVTVAPDCGATSASIVLMNVQNGQAVTSAAPMENTFAPNGSQKTATFQLGMARRPEHTHVRISLFTNGQEIYRTNPSPTLPGSGGTAAGFVQPGGSWPSANYSQPTPFAPVAPAGNNNTMTNASKCNAIQSELLCRTDFNCSWISTVSRGYCRSR